MNLILTGLSHLALGCPRHCPPSALTGRPLTPLQREAAGNVERLVAPMLRGDFSLGTRGGNMLDLAASLDAVESAEFGAPAPPSAAGPAGLQAARIAFMKGPAHFDPREWLSVFSAAVLVEPRLLRGSAPGAAGDGGAAETPSRLTDMVETVLAKKKEKVPAELPQSGARAEVLALLRDWAAVGRLRLAPASGPDLECATSRIFAVPKSLTEDRLVVDRQIENSKELALGGAARDLPSGSDMAEHWVPRGWTLRMSSEDLTDYFPSIDSSNARATTNGLSFRLTEAEARSLLPPCSSTAASRRAALRGEGERAPARGPLASGRIEGHGPLSLGLMAEGERAPARAPEARVTRRSATSRASPADSAGAGRRAERCIVPQFAGLPMGDCSAPDLAAEAHAAVLEASGFLGEDRRVRPRAPFPRGRHSEYLVYDDHVVLTAEPPKRKKEADKVARDMDLQRVAYGEVGLGVSVKKEQRAEVHGFALGSEVLGDCPMVGAERGRRWALSMIACRMAGSGKSDAKLLQRVLSSFLHVLLYRRPLLAILERAWRTASALERRPKDTVEQLPASVRNELALLSCLAPVMVTQLDCEVAPRVWATDASPSGLGSVEASMPAPIVEELWRHRERRGHNSWLCGRSHEYVLSAACFSNQEKSEHQELLEQEDEADIVQRVERVLAESFDIVEVFCGADALLSAACGRRGLRVGPRVDIAADPMWDLTSRRVCDWIIWLIQRRRAWGVHFAPPSGTFSPACRPPRRTSCSPWGLRADDAKVKSENGWVQMLVLALRACRAAWWGWVSLEHPAASILWDIPQVRELSRGRGWNHASLRLGPTLCYLGGINCTFTGDIDGFEQFEGPWAASPACAGVSGLRAAPPGAVRNALRQKEEPSRGPSKQKAPTPLATLGGSGLRAAPPEGARAYPAELVECWSAAIRKKYDKEDPKVSERELNEAVLDQRAAAERIWVNELCSSASWRLRRRVRHAGPEHINIKEVSILCSELGAAAFRWPRSRLMSFCDSRVACGALAKGRSSSSALNRPLRKLAADLIASDCHAGVCFVPTRIMPADGPSRGRPVPAARSVWPWWADALANGSGERVFDHIAALPKQSFKHSEWARFVVKLVFLQKDFDATLGYPGEGPPWTGPAQQARGPPEVAGSPDDARSPDVARSPPVARSRVLAPSPAVARSPVAARSCTTKTQNLQKFRALRGLQARHGVDFRLFKHDKNFQRFKHDKNFRRFKQNKNFQRYDHDMDFQYHVQECNRAAALQDQPPASRERSRAIAARAAAPPRGTPASPDALVALGVAAATPRNCRAPSPG